MTEDAKHDEEQRKTLDLTSGPGGTTGTGEMQVAGGGSGVGAAGAPGSAGAMVGGSGGSGDKTGEHRHEKGRVTGEDVSSGRAENDEGTGRDQGALGDAASGVAAGSGNLRQGGKLTSEGTDEAGGGGPDAGSPGGMGAESISTGTKDNRPRGGVSPVQPGGEEAEGHPS